MSIEAMKQALEALEDCYSTGGDNGQPLYQFYDDDLVNAARATLRTAIEQAEKQEPVGEVVVESMGVRGSDAMQVRIHFYKEVPPVGLKVYTTPPAAPVQEPVAAKDWEGAEYWMPLAWELCADECGEDACNDLIWEGAPIPEPWGERWLKYEDEAKRLIALVQKHTTPPAALVPDALATYEDDGWSDDYVQGWNDCRAKMLSTTPPAAQRQFVGLTDDDLDDIAVVAGKGNLYDLRIAVEAMLREKNT